MPQQLTPDTQVGIKPASTGSQPGEPFDLRKALHTVAHAPQRVQQMDQASLDATARTGIAVEAAEPSPPSDEFPRIPKGAEPYARGKYGSDDGPQDEQNSATMRPPGKGGETMGKEGQQAGQQGFQTDAARRVSADLDELLQPKKPVPLRQGVPLADVRAALEQASPNGNGTASAVLSGNGVFHTEEPLQESVDENGHRSLNGVTEPLGHMTVSLPHENGVVAVDSTIPDERVSERERVIEQKNRLREEIIHAVNTTYQEMEDTLLASIGRRLEGKHHEPAKEAVKEAKHLLAKATVQDRIVVRYGDLMHRLGPQELASLQEAVSRGESPDREAVLSLLQEGANKSVAQANRDAEGLPDEAVTVFRRAAEDEADETRRDVAYIRKNSLTEADRAVVGDLSPEESRLFNDVLQASYFKTRNGVRGRQRVLQHPVDLSPDTPGFSQRVATSMPVEGMISYLTDRASELQSKIDVISHSISHGTASVEDTIQLAELTASKEDTVGRMMLIDESSRAFWDVKDRQQVKKRPDIDIMNLIVEDQAQLLRLKNAGFFDGKPSQEAILALAKSQLSQRRELVLPRIPRGGGGARNARAEASAEPEKQKWELDIWRGEEPALAEPERFFPEDSSRPDALTDTGYPSTEATDRGIDHGRDERLEELIRRAREGKRPSVRKSLGESELLGRAVGGDEAARGELIDRHVGRSSDRFETVLEQFTDAERRRGDEGERERARIARETPREELSEEPVVLTKPEGRLRRLGRRLRVWNPAETSIVPPLVVAGGLLANLVRGGQGGHEIRYEAKTPTSGTPSGLVATPRPSEAPGTPGTANASPSVGIGLTPEGEASPTARAVIEQINTMTATPKPYETATPIPPTPTEVATRVSTEEPTDVPEPSSIASPTNTPTNTPSPSETATVTPSPTSTPSPPSATPTETATPSPEPSLLTPTETATAEATATVETGTPTSKEAEEMVDGMAMIKIDEPKDSISKQMQDKLLIGTAGEKSMSMDEFKKMYNDPDAVAAFLLVNLPRFNKDWEADGLPQRTEEEILATRDKVKRGEATMDKLWGKQVTYNEAGEVADKGKAGIDRVILGSEYMVWITDEDWKKAQAIIFKAEEDGTLDTLRDTLRRMLKKKGDEEK